MEHDLSLSEPVSRTGLQVSVGKYAWSRSAGKRLFDAIVASILFVISLPLMVVAAVAIKCSSRGPLLFRQVRVGKDGKTFQLLKFRTMVHGRRNPGPGLTRQGDPRIFPIGRLLRKWKLDELPQFLNVMRGDMSLVGPRPDLPEYLATLADKQMEILSIRPGITGSATLKFRHEADLLAQVPADKLQDFYTERILPEKVELDLEYARRATLFSDMQVLFRTVSRILS
jgi:lipopolysaccharide/colanic/teichoic acid biosynthesis glycosyltransferase